MTAFRYRALDTAGKESAGVLEADTGRAARGLLRERGLFPLEVASVAQGGAGGKATRRRLKEADLTLLTRQWATLLASGLTVEQALAVSTHADLPLEQTAGCGARGLHDFAPVQSLRGQSGDSRAYIWHACHPVGELRSVLCHMGP